MMRRIVIAICTLLLTHSLSAETPPACRFLDGRIYTLQQYSQPDSLALRLNLIQLSRQCHAGDGPAIFIWLLDSEARALDKLGRYDEAEHVVETFFLRYAEEAPDRVRASFYMERFRLLLHRGEAIGALASYQDSRPYLDALSVDLRLRAHINASIAHMRLGTFLEAQQIIDRVSAQVEPGSMAEARATALRGELLLEQQAFDEALVELQRADSLFLVQRNTTRSLLARMGIGRALEGVGQHEAALDLFTEIVEAVQQGQEHRTVIAAHYRRGQFLIKQGHFSEAKADLLHARALMDSTALFEYDARVSTALAILYHETGDTDRALVYYGRAAQSEHFTQYASNRKAITEAQRAGLVLALEKPPREPWLFSLLIILVLIIGIVIGLNMRGMFVRQDATHVPLLLKPKREDGWTDTFYQRLLCIFEVLAHPETVLKAVDFPDAQRLLGRNDIQRNMDLYVCAAALESARTGEVVDPRTQYDGYFRKFFERSTGQPCPRTVDRWRAFFTTSDHTNVAV